ncbi:MAG: hypothetical protein HRT88_07200 [Lentisphaeraceae bacterium]|nr:hypothetical protein [Lentisphaeraceae bacterium]
MNNEAEALLNDAYKNKEITSSNILQRRGRWQCQVVRHNTYEPAEYFISTAKSTIIEAVQTALELIRSK